MDPAAIRRVLDGAFGRSKESAAVDRLRQRGAVVLSLVALRAETIIGHVMFTAARLDAQAAPTWLDDEQRAPARPGRAEPRPPLRSPRIQRKPWCTPTLRLYQSASIVVLPPPEQGQHAI